MMLHAVILNVKNDYVIQHSYKSIYEACKTVDTLNRTKPDTMDLVIVKTSNEPIVAFGNPLEWIDFLEKAKFYLAMKDHWSEDDFYNNEQLSMSIQKVKKYMYGEL